MIPNNDITRALLGSDIASYRSMGQRTEYLRDQETFIEKMNTGRYGTMTSVLAKKYVTSLVWLEKAGIIENFRLMKKCILHFFTVFAFKKHSPYTKLFNLYIRRYYLADRVYFILRLQIYTLQIARGWNFRKMV